MRAGVEIERHDRVARRRRRQRVVVAGRDVEPPPLQVERRRRPRCRRRMARTSATPTDVFPVRCGRRRNHVASSTPSLPSRTRSAVMLPRNVQQGYSGLSERDSSHDATGMYASAVVHDRRRAQADGLVLLGALPPHQLARRGIERVEPAREVAEQQHDARRRPARRRSPSGSGRWPGTSTAGSRCRRAAHGRRRRRCR